MIHRTDLIHRIRIFISGFCIHEAAVWTQPGSRPEIRMGGLVLVVVAASPAPLEPPQPSLVVALVALFIKVNGHIAHLQSTRMFTGWGASLIKKSAWRHPGAWSNPGYSFEKNSFGICSGDCALRLKSRWVIIPVYYWDRLACRLIQGFRFASYWPIKGQWRTPSPPRSVKLPRRCP